LDITGFALAGSGRVTGHSFRPRCGSGRVRKKWPVSNSALVTSAAERIVFKVAVHATYRAP